MQNIKIYKVLNTIVILSLMTIVSSCDSESKDLFLDETDEVCQLYDYYVDDNGREGIVGYVLNSSSNENLDYKRVIVVSIDESFQSWGPMGEIVYKKDSISKLDATNAVYGLAMCQAMLALGIKRYPAQNWCFNKNKNQSEVYSGSWRLPTYNEIRSIFGSNGNKVNKLNIALSKVGGTQIDKSHYYWTCTEDVENYMTVNGVGENYDQANQAVLISPENYSFSNKDNWLKKNKYYVRAIKYIYYHN